jgi:hypothetical protein
MIFCRHALFESCSNAQVLDARSHFVRDSATPNNKISISKSTIYGSLKTFIFELNFAFYGRVL